MKVVVIGTGFGTRVMAGAYEEAGFSVEAVSPRDAGALSRVGAVDLVSVHAPPFLHRDYVMAALDSGAAVLCDKPFGRNAAEARAMRDQARAASALNFLNFEFRHVPARVKARALLRDGAIGVPRHISWLFVGNGLRAAKHRWLFDQAQAGGWIGAWGPHCVDTLRWLLDTEVVSASCLTRTDTTTRLDAQGAAHPSTAEDAFCALFTMGNGCTVSVDTACSTSVAFPQTVRILGSAGAIEIRDDDTVTVRRSDGQSEQFSFPAPPGDPLLPGVRGLIAEITRVLRDQRQTSPSFDDGLAVAEVLDQLHGETDGRGPRPANEATERARTHGPGKRTG